jgi:cation diffusion facilitator family transporter
MTHSSKKIFAAKLSIATAVSLAIMKFTVGVLTGSMAVLSSAIDSMLDILMSGVNFVAIRHAEQPADDDHAYGHGKFETMAALIQSLIIGGSGVWILLESFRRLINGAVPSRLGNGIVVLGISVIASRLISQYLTRVAKETDSAALKADSLHFAMDVYTNLALIAGLALMYLFKLPWLDSVLSILVSCYIVFEALKLVRHSMRDVLDEQLPELVRSHIEDIVLTHGGDRYSCHNLRTRKAGSQKIIDFHLTVCKHLSVEEAHQITDKLETEIEVHLNNSDITIHVEPCYRQDCPGQRRCHKGIIRSVIDHP